MNQKLYEGKAKVLYSTDDPDILRVDFKDDATAFNALKKGTIDHKGALNCAITSHLFQFLTSQGIATHFIRQISPQQMQVQAVKIILIEVVVRNIAAGGICKRLGLPLGQILTPPIVEYYYKNDPLGDPLITPDHIAILGLASPDQVDHLHQSALKINTHLQQFFQRCRLTLVDFKLEFGVNRHGEIILSDEISPDTCRLWDQSTQDENDRILDKDRFRKDLGKVTDAYQEVLQRILSACASA